MRIAKTIRVFACFSLLNEVGGSSLVVSSICYRRALFHIPIRIQFSRLMNPTRILPKSIGAIAVSLFLGYSVCSAVDLAGVSADTGIAVVDTPSSLGHGDLESDNQVYLFFEGITSLSSNTYAYTTAGSSTKSLIASAGTKVRSYMLHFDPLGSPDSSGELFDLSNASVTFNEGILGFLGDNDSGELDASDVFSSVSYENTIKGKASRHTGFGVNGDIFGPGGDEFSVTGSTIMIDKLVIGGANVDQIRVFTPVPEPGVYVGVLFGLGLVGYRAFQKKRVTA